MDLFATLARPVQAVFGHLADPSRLGDWLPQVTAADASPEPPHAAGAEFRLTMHLDGTEVAAAGEITAFEPPWLVGYRLFAGPRTISIRITCTAHGGGSRIHVHQPDHGTPLTIDLARLARHTHQEHQGEEQP